MTPPRFNLEGDPIVAGDDVDLRVDDDYPTLERPVLLRIGVGHRYLTADESEALGRALIEAAAEGRAHIRSGS